MVDQSPDIRYLQQQRVYYNKFKHSNPITTLRMSKIPDSLKAISHEIQSEMSQRGHEYKGHKIPKSVMDKYLKIGNQGLIDKFQGAVVAVRPYWGLTMGQFVGNVKGVVTGDWPFSENNRSIYLAIWGPVSLIFFTYLLHNAPYQNKFLVFSAGLIDLGLILLLAYLGYTYSNILKFPFNTFPQHLSLSSTVNLLQIPYCCICTGAPQPVITITTLIFVSLCSFLHFRIYNRSIRPTLLELLVLLGFMVGIYTGAAFLFYKGFLGEGGPGVERAKIGDGGSTSGIGHFTRRNFNNHY